MSRTARIDLGGVELDPGNECLWRDGEAISLRPKVYSVLHHLVMNPGRIVTKDELLDTVWADTVVGDAVLKVCVRELRAALGDDTQAPRFIATVHRRGYRYVGQSKALGPGPVSVQVEGPSEGPGEGALEPEAPSGFVARAAERKQFDAAFAALGAGARQTIFVIGSPGIGKSALVDEALGHWRRAGGVRIVRGRCQEVSGAKEAFLPFLEAVGELCAEPAVAQLLRSIAPTWFVQFPWLLSGDDRTQLERELHGATAGRMLRELDAFLVELSRQQPVVLALEDLHWSDANSVDLLAFLATRDAPARLLVLATARPVELIVHDHPLRTVKRELALQGKCTELALEFFSVEEVTELVRARLDSEAVPPSIPAWLFGRTEGHPLFGVHLLDHLVRGQHVQARDGGWQETTPLGELETLIPDSLAGIVESDVERCSAEERAVLEGAALAGYRFTARAAAHATDGAAEDAELLIDGLAARSEFVTAIGLAEQPDGSVTAEYRFTHALVRDLLQRRIPASRRARLQRRLGEKGEALFGDRAHEIASHLAEHFEGALMFEKAVHYRVLAAGNAARRYASTSGTQHLRAALALVPKLPPLHQAPETRRLELALARSLRDSGDVAAAASLFEGLAATAAALGDAAELWLLAASARSWLSRVECLRNVESALAAGRASGESPEFLAHVEGHAAYWKLLWTGWEPGARVASEAAVSASVAAGKPGHECAHRAHLAFFLSLESRYKEAAQSAAAAHGAALELGDVSQSLLADFFRAWALILGGAWGAAQSHITRAQGEAATNGHTPWAVLFSIQLAWLQVEEAAARGYLGGQSGGGVSGGGVGDGGRALASAKAAAEAAAPLGHAFIVSFAECVLALALIQAGELSTARDVLDRLRLRAGAGRYLMDWLCELLRHLGSARLELADGASDASIAAAEELAALAGPMGEATFTALAHALIASAKKQAKDARAARTSLKKALATENASPVALWRLYATAADLDRASNAARAKEHGAAASAGARALLSM